MQSAGHTVKRGATLPIWRVGLTVDVPCLQCTYGCRCGLESATKASFLAIVCLLSMVCSATAEVEGLALPRACLCSGMARQFVSHTYRAVLV